MPISYIVGSRQARPFTRWGFTLPPPRPQGPLPPVYLPTAGPSLAEAMMDEIVTASYESKGVINPFLERKGSYRHRALPDSARGIWTGGISDCMLVCAAYYSPTLFAWERVWFMHVQGGGYEPVIESINYDLNVDEDQPAPIPGCRYAVIASGTHTGISCIANDLTLAGIPSNNITTYMSATSNRGFAFGVDFSTGLFGETTGQGGVLPNNNPY